MILRNFNEKKEKNGIYLGLFDNKNFKKVKSNENEEINYDITKIKFSKKLNIQPKEISKNEKNKNEFQIRIYNNVDPYLKKNRFF